jgi:hypothetical protein
LEFAKAVYKLSIVELAVYKLKKDDMEWRGHFNLKALTAKIERVY